MKITLLPVQAWLEGTDRTADRTNASALAFSASSLASPATFE